jgi:hypothetical protein
MKLSDYVGLLNLLDTVDISADRTEAILALAATLQLIVQYQTQVGSFSDRLQTDFKLICSGIDSFTKSIDELKIRRQMPPSPD